MRYPQIDFEQHLLLRSTMRGDIKLFNHEIVAYRDANLFKRHNGCTLNNQNNLQ